MIEHRTNEKGSTLVEFAFVFMLLMTMMLGVVEFGRALYAYHFTSSAARQAARWAAVNGADCGAPPLGDNSCAAPATAGDVRNYVTQLATAASIDASGTGCGGSACLTTTPTWNPPGSNGPVICSTTDNSPGCTVEVQVSYNFNFLVPFVHSGSVTMSSTSQMVIAH